MKNSVFLGVLIGVIFLIVLVSAGIYDAPATSPAKNSTDVENAANAAIDAELNASARANNQNNLPANNETGRGNKVGIRIGEREIVIRELSPERKEIIAGRINAKTGLNLTVEDIGDGSTGSILRAYLSNGRYAIIKVLPETAAARALEVMRAKCGERNCTVELKEVGKGDEARAVYDVEAEKESRILFILKKRMRVHAEVDAETGEVIKVRKPWWSFVAKEKNETPDIV